MYYDIIISGGGLIGSIAALGLQAKGFSVAVIDKNMNLLTTADSRAFALAKKSKDILNDLGIWDSIANDAEPILDILVQDGKNNPITVHYNYRSVGEEPMGYMIEGKILNKAINNAYNNFDIYSATVYNDIIVKDGVVTINLADKQQIKSSLLVCAEGKNSQLRNLFKLPIIKFNYHQSSIVCDVDHELNHEGFAIENFFSGGPFAILPLKGGYKSSIVWTDKTNIVNMLMHLSDEEFIIELEKKFHHKYGKIKSVGKRVSYPISFLMAEYLCEKRTVFLGDAVHCIHPIAGQGFNLGLRDVESLIYNITNAKHLGLDIGGEQTLREFSHDRYSDIASMSFITDALNRVFSNKSLILKSLRNLGLMCVENSSVIKKFLIEHAMGLKFSNR